MCWEGWCPCEQDLCLLGLWWVSLQALPSPFQKPRRFISPTHPESVSFFLNSYPQKTSMAWFFCLPSPLSVVSPYLPPQVVISSCNSCGVALPAAQLVAQGALKWSLQEPWSVGAVPWHHRDSCPFLLTAVCMQNCMLARDKDCNFPGGTLQKWEYSWKNSWKEQCWINALPLLGNQSLITMKVRMWNIPGKRNCTIISGLPVGAGVWSSLLIKSSASCICLHRCSTERLNTGEGLYTVRYDWVYLKVLFWPKERKCTWEHS